MFVLQGYYKGCAFFLLFSTVDFYRNHQRPVSNAKSQESSKCPPHSAVHSCCLDFFRCSQIKCLTGAISWLDHTASKSLLKWSFSKSRVCSGLLQSSEILKWQAYTLFKDTKSRLWVIFSLCKNLAQERWSCTLLAETSEHASDCKFIYRRKLQWFRSVRFLRQIEILWSIMVTWYCWNLRNIYLYQLSPTPTQFKLLQLSPQVIQGSHHV